jgi:spermidine synthase
VTLVDLDPAMTELGAGFPLLVELNRGAFADPRVRVVNADAFVWIQQPGEAFDAAIVDFPDPSSFSLGKLYTTRFYRLLRARLKSQAGVSVQCTSPLSAPQSYWCVVRTLEEAGFAVRPYHASVPAFGEWGFVLAGPAPFDAPGQLPDHLRDSLRFLTDPVLRGMFDLPRDMVRRDAEVNRLNNQILVRYYEDEWDRWK